MNGPLPFKVNVQKVFLHYARHVYLLYTTQPDHAEYTPQGFHFHSRAKLTFLSKPELRLL